MKKSFFTALMLTGSTFLVESHTQFSYQAAQKQAFIPYYMKNSDSSKINAIKTDQAGDGCHDDCSNSQKSIVPQQHFIKLQNASTEKSSLILISVIAKN